LSAYKVSADAWADLGAIWDYIAEDSADAADRWIARLFDAFELIGSNPCVGHVRRDLTLRDVRFWSVARYVIIYRPQPIPVEILSVTQGGRLTKSYVQQRS
jgi:plasmid stabilization system protein ParE